MNITITTVGSRGDVQPFVALGLGLQGAGHSVQIITDPTFEDFIRGEGLGFIGVKADPRKALQEDVRRIGSNPLRLTRWIKDQFKPLARQLFSDLLAACTGTDAILFSSLAFASYHIAEALDIPFLATYLQPATPTRSFASPLVSIPPNWLPFKGHINWWSFRLSNWLFFWMIKDTVNECRREILDLPPVPWKVYASVDVSETPIIYGYSSHVIPKPPDWGEWLHVSGYWFLDYKLDWVPPAELVEFIEAGPPPIYVGFGSMIEQEVDTVTNLVVNALQRAGQRGILLGGWSELGARGLPGSVLKVDDVPHDWLFPRMAAVVHHGGAGTTAVGLRAGVPSVIIPFFGDQPFWGDRVYKLGVGPRPIPRKKLSVDRLAHAIRVATGDEAIRQRASKLGEAIRAENGVANAVRIVEDYLNRL